MGQNKGLAVSVAPAGGFLDRSGTSTGFAQPAVSAIGVGLQGRSRLRDGARNVRPTGLADSRIPLPVARDRPNGRSSHTTTPRIGFAPGEHRVVAVDALAGEHASLQALEDRRQHADAEANLVGQRQQTQGNAFSGVALSRRLSRWCWPNFSKTIMASRRTGPAAGNDVERRGRLRNAAVPSARSAAPYARNGFRRARAASPICSFKCAIRASELETLVLAVAAST